MVRYHRNPKVEMTQVEDEIFLVEPDGEGIFHLNAIGAGVWRLLEEPLTPDDILETVMAAFPDIPGERVTRDVRGLLDRLAAERLVLVQG